MNVRLWRLVKASRVTTAWDGEGAFRFGGRWNSRGTRIVYASSSLALALLEVLVHVDPGAPLPALCAISAQVADTEIAEIPGDTDSESLGLDADSIRFPYSLGASRRIGDNWTRSHPGVVLAVPSAIVPTERNFLINPAHAKFTKLIISDPQSFSLDPRLTAPLAPRADAT